MMSSPANVQTTIQQFKHFAEQSDYEGALSQLNLLKNQMPQQLFDKIVKLMAIDAPLESLEPRKIEVNKDNLSLIDEMIHNHFLARFGIRIPQKDEIATSSIDYLTKKYQFTLDDETIKKINFIAGVAFKIEEILIFCPFIQLVQKFLGILLQFVTEKDWIHQERYCEALHSFRKTKSSKKLIRFIEETLDKEDQDVGQALIHLLKLPNDFLYEYPSVCSTPLVLRDITLVRIGLLSFYGFKEDNFPFLKATMFLVPKILPEDVLQKWHDKESYKNPLSHSLFHCITDFEKGFKEEFGTFLLKLVSIVKLLNGPFVELANSIKKIPLETIPFITFLRKTIPQLIDSYEYLESVNEWMEDQINKFKEKIKFMVEFEIYFRINSLETILSSLKGKTSKALIKQLKMDIKEFFRNAVQSKEMLEKIEKLKREKVFLKYGAELSRVHQKLDNLMNVKVILEVNLDVMRRYIPYFDIEITASTFENSHTNFAAKRALLMFHYTEIQFNSGKFSLEEARKSETIKESAKVLGYPLDLTNNKVLVVKNASLNDFNLIIFLRELGGSLTDDQHSELDEVFAKLKIEAEAQLASLPLIPFEKLETKEVEPKVVEETVSSESVVPFCLQSHMKLVQDEFSFIHLLIKDSKKELSASLENAEHHLHNLFVLLERTFQQISNASRSALFSTFISSISEGTLVIEQLLRSIDLLFHPLKKKESVKERYTHNLHELFNRSFMELTSISHKELELIYGLDRGEIYSRNIANFLGHSKRKNRLNYAKELLNMIYKWHYQMDDLTLEQVSKEMLHYYNDLFVVLFKLFSSFEKRESSFEVAKLSRLTDLMKTYSKELETVLKQQSDKMIAPKEVELPGPVLNVINKLKKVLSFLIKKDESQMLSDNFENILNNHLTRLVAELERDPNLSAKEIRLHYSTILQLNEFIAKEMLESYVILLGKNVDKVLSIQELIELAGCKNEQFSKVVRQFLERGKTRNLIRYDGENRLLKVKNKHGKKVKKAMQKSAKLVHHTLSLNPGDEKEGFETVLHEKGKDLVQIRTLALEDVYLTVRLLTEVIKIVDGHDFSEN